MSFLSGVFGKKKTPQEKMREYKRQIDRTVRELERERTKMQNSEKKLVAEMRKMAKQNQMDAMRVMAKDLVRTRKYCTQFYKMKAQMQALSLRLQTLNSTAEMANAMKGVTKTMKQMNSRMNIPAMQKIMMEFEMENEKMGMKDDMMNDAIDDVMDDDLDEEDETDAMVNQVLDEIGLDFSAKVGVKQDKIGVAEEAPEDDDLQSRLDKLKKS
ncbi:Charged multivesicular body protein 2a-like protein 2 [Diplonema papillatum]|nr:Charged multivesicular body protein 2a-like protein 2 [Diplonema papillatum]